MLFFSNLHASVKDEDLSLLCNKALKKLQVSVSKVSKTDRGFAFVELQGGASEEAAKHLMRVYNNTVWKGKRLVIQVWI